MTREEAISLLRRYRRDSYHYDARDYYISKRNVDYMVSVYGNRLVETLIRAIRNSTEPPLDVVYDYYSMFDDVLSESDDDHFETHRFAAIVELETGNILRYLKTVEKEQNEDAKN